MQVIKLTTPWRHSFLPTQLNPEIKNFKFEIDNDCSEADYWIVWGDLPYGYEKMSVNCHPDNIFFMTDEAQVQKTYNQQFLNQFKHVITCRKDMIHKSLIHTHEINHWHLKKSFLDVFNIDRIQKTKKLSVVCSDLTILEGHKKRYAFVNKLIGHFKDQIDVFGKGINPIDDKWNALAPYKYSVAIENSAIPGYFTEKIAECYLAHTLPIYYGAPDITQYFNTNSLLKIDIDDYKTSILSIEKLLEEDPWDGLEKTLIDQKLLYLSSYHLFPALCTQINNLTKTTRSTKKYTIKGHDTYYKHYKMRKIYNSIKNNINW